MVTLRPYQVQALDTCRAHIRGGRRRVVIVAPTGSGKTSIASQMISSAVTRGRRALFLAHRRELLDQCHDRLRQFGVASSIIRANDRRSDLSLPVQVASVQTLVRRLDQFAADAFELLVVDEAHHIRANTYERILNHFTGAMAIVGLTATPCRRDGRGLRGIFDAIVEAATLQDLIEQGFLVPIRMFTTPGLKLDGVHVRQGDYILSELGDAMNSAKLVGNIVAEWQRRASDRQTVVFGTTVAHSEAIRDRFREAGVRAEHIDGGTPDEQREAILARVQSGATQVITNCQILTEGWDMPAISCCILARPTKSLSLYLQMAGRVLRPASGKTDCIILDHANCYREHGTVDSDRCWSLTDDRARTGKGESPSKECPECGAILAVAIRTCPECGNQFAPRQAMCSGEDATELVEVTGRTRREEFFNLVEQVRQLRRADGQPYKLSAAVIQYKNAFGEWPRWSWQQEAGIR